MKLKSLLLSLGILSSCNNNSSERINYWSDTDLQNQLRPELKKEDFENLHGFDFGWFILEPIDLESEDEKIVELTKRFSPIQKTIYFFWFLDAQVTNGGFTQFYYNGYDNYLPAIIEGLKVTNDTELLDLIEKVESYFQKNKEEIKKLQSKGDHRGIGESYPQFSDFSTTYYRIHEKSMGLIEQYARSKPQDVGVVQ